MHAFGISFVTDIKILCKNLTSSQSLFVQDYLFFSLPLSLSVSISALLQIDIIIADAATLQVPQAEI